MSLLRDVVHFAATAGEGCSLRFRDQTAWIASTQAQFEDGKRYFIVLERDNLVLPV